MEYQAKISNKPKSYAKIPLLKRKKLVQLVIQKSFSISKASIKLSIRPSTAKLILKKYREEGAFFEKRSDKLTRLAIQKQTEQFPEPTPIQQTSPLCQNGFISGAEFPTFPFGSNVLARGESAYMGVAEGNRIQNYCWVGFTNYGLIPYGGYPFFF